MLRDRSCFKLGLRLRLLPVAVLVVVAATSADSLAVTLTQPLQPGDLIFTNGNANGISHIRNGTRLGGVIPYGGGGGNERIGGVFSDSTGAIYFAGQPGGANIPFPDRIVERIGIGETTSSILLTTPELPSGQTLREGVIAPSGNLYVLYSRDIQPVPPDGPGPDTRGQGTIDRFTPNGAGGYTRSTVGVLTSWVGNDRGNGHVLSLTASESYLLASSRDQNRVWSMNLATGATEQWTTPAVRGPISGAQNPPVNMRPSAQAILDPFRPNRVLVPMGNDGLYEVDYDPATGTFPNPDPRRLTSDAVAAFIDGLIFDGSTLIVSTRDDGTNGSLRRITEAELAAASSGTPFNIFDKPAFYTGTDARIARDIAIAIPEPTMGALVTLAFLGLLARRHRRA
jgi:hypothetical protein